MIIAFLLVTITALAQENEKIRVARLAVKTAVEAEEKAKFETYFKEISPDSLDVKRGIIFMGKYNGKTCYYIKVGNKNYLIDSFDVNLKISDVIYNERSEGDTVKCYADKGVILYTIQ